MKIYSVRMKATALAALSVLAFASLAANASPELRSIRGPGFEGIIFTPDRVRADLPGFYWNRELWTPPRDAVLQAEKALPLAIKALTSFKADCRGPNFPTSCPAKNGTNLKFSAIRRDDRPDSVIDNNSFLLDVAPRLSDFKRQYIGAIINGKKVLYLSFIHNYVIDTDAQDWRHDWIAVLDGGDLTWSVLYDPASDSFSDWEE